MLIYVCVWLIYTYDLGQEAVSSGMKWDHNSMPRKNLGSLDENRES